MTQFISIASKTFINRDHVVSIKYVGNGTWFVNTVDNKCHECNDEKAIRVLLYGDTKMADAPMNADAIAEPVAQPNVDWVAQAKAIITAAYRKADTQHDDCWFICRDVYATIRPIGAQNYTIILRTSHIVSYADTVGSIIVNPITGEKKAAIKEDLDITQKKSIDYLVAMLPTS